jgi:hypothetical protein
MIPAAMRLLAENLNPIHNVSMAVPTQIIQVVLLTAPIPSTMPARISTKIFS